MQQKDFPLSKENQLAWNEHLCLQITFRCVPEEISTGMSWTVHNQTLCCREGLDIFKIKEHYVYYWSLYTNYQKDNQFSSFEHKRFDEVSEELLNFCISVYPVLATDLLKTKYTHKKNTTPAL